MSVGDKVPSFSDVFAFIEVRGNVGGHCQSKDSSFSHFDCFSLYFQHILILIWLHCKAYFVARKYRETFNLSQAVKKPLCILYMTVSCADNWNDITYILSKWREQRLYISLEYEYLKTIWRRCVSSWERFKNDIECFSKCVQQEQIYPKLYYPYHVSYLLSSQYIYDHMQPHAMCFPDIRKSNIRSTIRQPPSGESTTTECGVDYQLYLQ